MFSGIYQQDSTELLNSLLDGMHEDLNRVRKKPYNETPDLDGARVSRFLISSRIGKPHQEIADEMWRLYRLRNDSVIVDLFQGEYRSIVECLVCGAYKVSF